jgi:glycosyltransferase involved in cell wall biosynthesis
MNRKFAESKRVKSTLLLYRTGFAATNGTSVQVQRLLYGRESESMHAMWDSEEAGDESIEFRAVAPEVEVRWPFPFRRGRGLYLRWLQRRSDREVLRDLEHRSGRSVDHAWVVCMWEKDARRIRGLLAAAGDPPFVLHVMDLLDAEMSESATPCFHDLIRRADHVFCISAPIEATVQAAGAKSTSVLRCVSDFSPAEDRELDGPLRLAIVGTIWNWGYTRNRSLECLEEAWHGIAERFPGAELHYVGGSAELLPDCLKKSVTNHGRRSPAECERILHGCHAALLPVSHPPGSIAQFSLPSRLADYLACGLPTIVSAEQGTAIHEFVAPLEGKCVANVQTPAELLSAKPPVFTFLSL